MPRRSDDQERILVTIPISHFCEKARWALERAGLDYTEKRHIQIVHRVAVKRAGGGTTAPVLRAAEGVYDQSRAILLYTDEHVPAARRLYPAQQPDRSEVLALEERFDTVLGPQGRLWLYHEVFKDAKRFAPWNLTGVPAWERRVFPFVLAPAKIIIRRHFDISDRTAKEAAWRVDEESTPWPSACPTAAATSSASASAPPTSASPRSPRRWSPRRSTARRCPSPLTCLRRWSRPCCAGARTPQASSRCGCSARSGRRRE